MKKSKVRVIDLFAGAGGLSVGATQAGASVALSLELNPFACDTLRANDGFHGKVIEGDISAFSGLELRKQALGNRKVPLVVVGGPPCQPFSKAAYWVEGGDDAAYRRARAAGEKVQRPPKPTAVRADPRRDLVAEYWRVVEQADADGFVFENVPSLKHPRNRPIYDGLVARARGAGFYVTELVANAVDYGVAQARSRVVLIGSRRKQPQVPAATHVAEGFQFGLSRVVTSGEALQRYRSKKFFEPEEVVTGRWAKHLEEVPPGWNYKAHTAWAGHPNPTFVTETRFWNFLLKLDPCKPSWTLAANPGPWTGPFHWDSRRLRTVELAALQGFPDGYVLQGSRRERVKQMGNAVPVPVARAMISSLLASLE